MIVRVSGLDAEDVKIKEMFRWHSNRLKNMTFITQKNSVILKQKCHPIESLGVIWQTLCLNCFNLCNSKNSSPKIQPLDSLSSLFWQVFPFLVFSYNCTTGSLHLTDGSSLSHLPFTVTINSLEIVLRLNQKSNLVTGVVLSLGGTSSWLSSVLTR